MIDYEYKCQLDRVRAAARELEAAINAIDGVSAEVELISIEVTNYTDPAPRYVYEVRVALSGERMQVYP